MNEKIMAEYQKAKTEGYKYVASVVKSKFNTTYYHIVLIDDVISKGSWIPSYSGSYPNKDNSGYWHGRIGTAILPDKTILRQEIYRRARAAKR